MSAPLAGLAFALAGCGNPPDLAGPSSIESAWRTGSAKPGYDAAAAVVVVDDVLTRVLPTLTSGADLAALEKKLAALAEALPRKEPAALHDYVDAAQEALKQYGAGAPEEEEPELEGVDVALDHVAEGLAAPTGGKKSSGGGV